MIKGLKFKIPVIIIGLALSSASTMAFLSWMTTRSYLVADSKARLQFVAAAAGSRLKLTFDRVQADLVNLSANSAISGNAIDLIDNLDPAQPDTEKVMAAFAAPERANRLAVDGASLETIYGRAHRRVHAAVRSLMDAARYDDVLILDTAGHVAYTAAKGSDFAKSVTDPSLAGTGLARLFRSLRQGDDKAAVFEDFAPYPTSDRSVAFIGRPLTRRANAAMGTDQATIRIGYLVLRLPYAVVDGITEDRHGLGTTGQVFAVGDDDLLRSTPSSPDIHPGDPARRVGQLAAFGSLSRGELRPNLARSDSETFVETTPVRLLGVHWTLVATQDVADALASLSEVGRDLILSGIAVVAFTAMLGLLMGLSIVRPIVALTRALQSLARREILAVIPGHGREDEIGEIARAVADIHEMTAADMHRTKALSDENHRIANLDALTQLANRRCFMAKLAALIESGTATGATFALGLIDLDGFKPVNDVFGHAAGDAVLVEVGNRLRATLGADMLVARLGGDEFAFVLPDIDDVARIRQRSEALCQTLQVAIDLPAGSARVSASIGLALFPDAAQSAAQILDCADHALYHAKSHRRGAPVIFNARHETEILRRSSIEQELRRADLDAEMTLRFQPQVDTARHRIVGIEALARWTSPVLGAVAPTHFIPIAERAGLMARVTPVLFAKMLAASRSIPDTIPIAFNLSTWDVASSDTIEQIKRLIHDNGLVADRFELEITETSLMQDFGQASKTLQALKAMGFRITLDDFGSGYSSFSYLQRLAFDKIKIDRSFVKPIVEDQQSRTIVRSILDLCRNLGSACVVEGVETIEQVAVLESLGCGIMQGYVFSEPVGLDSIDAVLEAYTFSARPRDRFENRKLLTQSA